MHHNFQKFGSKSLLLNEVFYSSGSSNNNMDASTLEGLSVFTRVGATDAAASVNFDELTETEDNFVNLLSKFSSGSQDNGLALRRLGID